MKSLKSLTGNKVWRIKYTTSFVKKMFCKEKIKLSKEKKTCTKKKVTKNREHFFLVKIILCKKNCRKKVSEWIHFFSRKKVSKISTKIKKFMADIIRIFAYTLYFIKIWQLYNIQTIG